jgi:serralysin
VSITQEPANSITYWHVELDWHEALIAEGLAAESYLDTGNRAAFGPAAGSAEMHRNIRQP